VTLVWTTSHCSGGDHDYSSYLTLSNNYTTLTYGWTCSGIFTAFHPSLLNWIQVQLPLEIPRQIQYQFYDSIETGPQADAFLWDGSYDLPTLHINIHINSLPCLPSHQLYDAVLQDITALVYKLVL